MDSAKNQDQHEDQLQHPDQEDPKDLLEEFSFSELVSWFVSHRSGGVGQKNTKKESPVMGIRENRQIYESPVITDVKEQRKNQVKENKDNIINISRSTENAVMECMICGKEIRPNQAFRALPKDKNCQEERVYHLRTCGPGSLRWKAFKENGKKALRESISEGQISFEWGK